MSSHYLEEYQLGIQEHPILSIEQYTFYFGSVENAVHRAHERTDDIDFDQPSELYEHYKEELERESIRDTTSQQRLKYGSDWGEIRLDVLDRDEWQCRVCGVDAEDTKLDVHHITPARTFDEYDRMNDQSNLITLCASCHGMLEGHFTDADPTEFVSQARDELQE